jgi:hypothetical protein
MFLPIDTSQMSFTAADEPRQVLDFESREPKADRNGQPIYALRVFADLLGAVITVKFAGEAAGVGRGSEVSVTGLTAIWWEIDGRNGLAFRAERVEAAPASSRRVAS